MSRAFPEKPDKRVTVKLEPSQKGWRVALTVKGERVVMLTPDEAAAVAGEIVSCLTAIGEDDAGTKNTGRRTR